MKNLWKYVTAAFALLVGLFFYERNKRLDSEAKLENAETKKEDAVLNQHTTDLKKALAQEEAEAMLEKNEKTSKEELLKFFNKDNK